MYDKELNYNFYNILAVKSGVNRGLHFNYEGRANEPNVLLADSKEVQKYVSKNLYVFSCDSEADGEMIIENECTSNYGKKVYLRFLLNTEDLAAPNEIDKLFNNSTWQKIRLYNYWKGNFKMKITITTSLLAVWYMYV